MCDLVLGPNGNGKSPSKLIDWKTRNEFTKWLQCGIFWSLCNGISYFVVRKKDEASKIFDFVDMLSVIFME